MERQIFPPFPVGMQPSMHVRPFDRDGAFRAVPGKKVYRQVQPVVDAAAEQPGDDQKVRIVERVVERVVERIVFRDPPKPRWTDAFHVTLRKHIDRPVTEDERFTQCHICQEHARCIVMEGCGHCSSCVECTTVLFTKAVLDHEAGVKCPVCRAVSERVCYVWL